MRTKIYEQIRDGQDTANKICSMLDELQPIALATAWGQINAYFTDVDKNPERIDDEFKTYLLRSKNKKS